MSFSLRVNRFIQMVESIIYAILFLIIKANLLA